MLLSWETGQKQGKSEKWWGEGANRVCGFLERCARRVFCTSAPPKHVLHPLLTTFRTFLVFDRFPRKAASQGPSQRIWALRLWHVSGLGFHPALQVLCREAPHLMFTTACVSLCAAFRDTSRALQGGGFWNLRPKSWEVLNGVGVDGVGVIFPFFTHFSPFSSLFSASPKGQGHFCSNLLQEWGISLRPRLHRPRAKLIICHTKTSTWHSLSLVQGHPCGPCLRSQAKSGLLAKGVSAESSVTSKKQTISKGIGPGSAFGTQCAAAKWGVQFCKKTNPLNPPSLGSWLSSKWLHVTF